MADANPRLSMSEQCCGQGPGNPFTRYASHILGQPGRVWCGILSLRTLQALAVMLLGQSRLISRLQIGHIVGQIKENWLVVVRCSLLLSSRN